MIRSDRERFIVFQMNKDKATTSEPEGKRTERLARLKELHFRRVRIGSFLFFTKLSACLAFRMKLEN